MIEATSIAYARLGEKRSVPRHQSSGILRMAKTIPKNGHDDALLNGTGTSDGETTAAPPYHRLSTDSTSDMPSATIRSPVSVRPCLTSLTYCVMKSAYRRDVSPKIFSLFSQSKHRALPNCPCHHF